MQKCSQVVVAVVMASLMFSSANGLFAQTTLPALGKGEGKVDILAWPGYIEHGETDKAYD